jgi:uncharacterized protein (DUF427 family)
MVGVYPDLTSGTIIHTWLRGSEAEAPKRGIKEKIMVRALWNGKVIAESDHTERVEGNHYFPPEALHSEYLQPSDTRTICPWKGKAHYFSLVVDGKKNDDSAWYYPDPKPAAQSIAGKIAFWKGVRIEA